MKKHRRTENAHDYQGSCGPRECGIGCWETFSVSIFQWVKGKTGRLKKTKSVYRVKGSVSNSEKVYARAEELCDLFDNCTVMSRKSETVRE